jgi:RNA polymerase sigma-70 factor (ECF subfamily)
MSAMLGLAAVAVESDADLIIALTDRYYAAILNYLHQLVYDRSLAEELTQDVFLKAFDKRGQLSEVGNQRAWLYRVATNLAINAIKRRRRFTWLPWHLVDSLPVHQADPGQRAGERSAVEKALAALPLPYRTPLLLRDNYGFTISEIAGALNLRENTVSARLHRARRMFSEAYERESGE